MGETVIELKKVSKDFYLYQSNLRRAFGILFDLKPKETKHALKNISLKVNRGDIIGVLGKVDSGRTTLLKIISGVAYATKGKVKVDGTMNCFLNRKVGFDYKFTCRENIYMKAIAAGVDKDVLKEHEQEICEYAELGTFADLPMNRAPNGIAISMALAVHLEKDADIMIIDENVCAGGEETAAKNEKRLVEYLNERSGITVIMANQRKNLMRKICNRFIVLEKGEIIYDGNEIDVAYRTVSTGAVKKEPVKTEDAEAETVKKEDINKKETDNSISTNSIKEETKQ